MTVEDQNTLITYGSLMPGKSNYHVIKEIPGEWMAGKVRGHLINPFWEQLGGYPALSLDESIPWEDIDVAIIKSDDLEPWWPTIDYFEGDAYKRVMIPYRTTKGRIGNGWIYVCNRAS